MWVKTGNFAHTTGTRFLHAVRIGFCALLLAACGGGGGGGGGSVSSPPAPSQPQPQPTQPPLAGPCEIPAAVCTDVQLGGAVTGSNVAVTLLRDPVTLIEQGSTPSLEDVRQQAGAESWDQATDLEKLLLLGKFLNDEDRYESGILHLMRASGGLDQDADSDNLIDGATAQVVAAAASVLGEWHALIPGDLVDTGGITPLTEAVYRYLEPDLADLSDGDILDRMDELARNVVGDIDGSGGVDYSDLLRWDRHSNSGFYLHDIAAVNELAAAVRGNATVSTVRQLSLAVLQIEGEPEQTYTLSGAITVPPTHRVDGDVNNPSAPLIPNDALLEAQFLETPIILGGYANVPGEGDSGRSRADGDTEDYYRINLLADQLLSLVIADSPATNDLDLYLYDANGSLVDASLGVTGFEQLTVPADGQYIVRVSAFEDPVAAPFVVTASNYQLSVADSEDVVQMQTLKLSDDFVPGEIIARFRDRTDVNSLERRARFTGMRVRGGGLQRANLMTMDFSAGDQVTQRKLKTLLALKRLRQKDEVESAGLNYRVRAAIEPNDARYFQQEWHYRMINLPRAWDNPRRGDGAIVAVIDSGIRSNHPDLNSKLLPGYDFFADDNDPLDPGDSQGGSRSSFHGTHVAGTVAAESNNRQGVAGVAWEARIMPLRVLGPDGGTSYDVLQAVRYAAGLENDSGRLPDRRADVINLSLGGGGFNAFDQQIYTQVSELGIIVVAAAGNDSSSAFTYPASYEGVISVGAVNINRERASYSNFGSAIDVAAPGGDSQGGVVSTGADDSVIPTRETYTILVGTSMATPHVSGTMALMKSIYPALTHADVEELLSRGLLTNDLGTPGRDNSYGWGLIDALKAVMVAEDLAAGGDIVLEPSVCTSTDELNFGNFADALPLSIINCGTGTLVVESTRTVDPWVTMTPVAVDASGVGRYTVRVDRNQLPVGRSFSSIDVLTNDREVQVQVVVEQPEPGALATGDAGVHYILLLNAQTGAVVQEVERSAVDGLYNYRFTDVPPGVYRIIGGSDADNDLLVCDPGEACGAWPALESDQPDIVVDQDLENLDFTTTFNDGIISTQQAQGKAASPRHRRSAYRGPGGER